MKFSLQVTGIKELDTVLNGLPDQVEHKILQQANAEAAKLVVDAAKGLAPEGPTGNLVDSIGTIKPSVAASEYIGETHSGPRRGRYKGYAGHLVEFGTKKRDKGHPNRGTMPKKPFMEPAFEKTKDRMFNNINQIIGKKLYNYMRRIIKR